MGAYLTQELNINFLSSNMLLHIQDGMTECKLYLWSKQTNI